MQWTSAPNIGKAPLPQRARELWKARFAEWNGELEKLLEAERAQLPPWIVVGFGSGIAAWFGLDGPGQWAAFLCVGAAVECLCEFVAVKGFLAACAQVHRRFADCDFEGNEVARFPAHERRIRRYMRLSQVG